MRPIFTVHAGEYLVASELERRFPQHRIWIPSKDSGIDLLVTGDDCSKVASLQVKFSKDHLASGNELRATSHIRSGGWWAINRKKLKESKADYWVLVLCRFNSRKYDYVTIKPRELAARYDAIAPEVDVIQSYFWVTQADKCWETRALGKAHLGEICAETFQDEHRDFTSFLNCWPWA